MFVVVAIVLFGGACSLCTYPSTTLRDAPGSHRCAPGRTDRNHVFGILCFEATALNNKQAFTLGLLTSLNGPSNRPQVYLTRCSGGAFANHTGLSRPSCQTSLLATRASPLPHPSPIAVRDTVSWYNSTPTHRLSRPYCCFCLQRAFSLRTTNNVVKGTH